jgi:hypothetical protein
LGGLAAMVGVLIVAGWPRTGSSFWVALAALVGKAMKRLSGKLLGCRVDVASRERANAAKG